MAKSGQYTRVRRLVMQGVMVCILGGTVALAALVSRRQSAEVEVQLTQPIEVGRLRVWLPEDWEVAGPKQLEGGGGGVVVTATEPGREPARRTITVLHYQPTSTSLRAQMEKWSPPMPPAQRRKRFETIEFLGTQGMMNEVVTQVVPPDGGEPRRLGTTYAVAMMPDGWAVLVQVEGEMAFGPSTRRVLEQVAQKLELLPTPTNAPTTRQ